MPVEKEKPMVFVIIARISISNEPNSLRNELWAFIVYFIGYFLRILWTRTNNLFEIHWTTTGRYFRGASPVSTVGYVDNTGVL